MSPNIKRRVTRLLGAVSVAALAFGLLPISPASAAVEDICPAPGQTDQFTDDDGNTHEFSINCAAAYDLVKGLTATTYGPQQFLTRGQAATILVNLIEEATGTTLATDGTNDFSDTAGTTHEGSIEKAADNGIVVGFDDGTFRPGALIIRAQFATIAVQATEHALGAALPTDATDTFDDDDASPHEGNIEKAADNGIVAGLAPRVFGPDFNVTRGQVATIVINIAGNVLFPAGEFAPGAVGVSLNETSVPQGGQLTGTIRGAQSATVSGCGLNNQALNDTDANTAGIQFSVTIPADQAAGNCTLTFTLTDADGGTTTITRQITVTAAEGGDVTNQTVTARPELVSATIVQTNASGPNVGTVIRYDFDENVTGRTPTANLFFAYAFDGTRYVGDFANIDTADSSAVFVRFDDAELRSTTVTGQPAQGSDALRVATVEYGAVADDTFTTRTAEAFNPIGDAQLNPGSTTGGQTRTFQAGRTEGPDLLAVTNFRQDPLNETQTLVDFTFDEAATVTNLGGFHLVLRNGVGDIVCLVQSGSGTTTVTVVCPEGATGDLSAANVARGYVDFGTVSDDTDDSTIDDAAGDPAQGNLNPLQAADVGNNGNSDTPDLVSATFDETATGTADVVIYTFDEAVTLPAGSTGALFGVYDADGNVTFGTVGTAQRSTANNTQVRVEFTDGTLFDAVGAFVEEGAVQEDTIAGARPNQEDEEGVANSNTDTGGTTSTERTAGPDLTGVAVNPVTDVFGTVTNYTATYTFDERLASVAKQAGFHLVLGDGTRLTSVTCSVGTVPAAGGGTQTSNTVTCTDFTGTDTQTNQAVLGTVEFGSVVAQDGGPTNPEGAEVTTGATAGQPQP